MKMRVLLVDDEPLILYGLSMLVDWESEGYEIVGSFTSGNEALEYLKEYPVELVIVDVKMPVMSGLELVKTVRENNISDAYFIIASGYNDFHYVQTALRYSCMDYLLKPIQKENLLACLRVASKNREVFKQKTERDSKMQRAYLEQSLIALTRGNYSQEQLEFVSEYLKPEDGIRFIHIRFGNISMLADMTDSEIGSKRNTLVENCRSFLGEEKKYLICNISDCEEENEIGIICCGGVFREKGQTLKEFIDALRKQISMNLDVSVTVLVGKRVDSISEIAKSYSSACTLRHFVGFQKKKNIYYYEEELQIPSSCHVMLCKDNLDHLLTAIEKRNQTDINRYIDDLYMEMETMGMPEKMVSMNMNYLVFQMIHLAVEQDGDVRQDEVMQYINEHITESGIISGSRSYLRKFCNEYAEYLAQLRRNVSGSVLQIVEKEIQDHYAMNLTLRDLGQKYYINSSYLGQIFKKEFGKSFKDYLSDYRIMKASDMLLNTDLKIGQIAEKVGYLDIDYFVSKFIERKGCTPSKYRKNSIEGNQMN